MFSGWFKPNPTLVEAFERQFGEEGGLLVYRRDGTGTAYRVTQAQRATMIAAYLSDVRKNSRIMYAVIWLVLLGSVVGMLGSGLEPGTAWSWVIIGAPLVLLTAWFVWANRQAMGRPELQLARTQPVLAAPLSGQDKRRKVLSQVSYGQLALSAMAGFVIVLLGADYFDIWAGWGRLVWIVPAAFIALAATQAYRKFRSEKRNALTGRER